MTVPDAPRASYMKLPVWEIIGKSYGLVFHGLDRLAIAAFGPFCLGLVISALQWLAPSSLLLLGLTSCLAVVPSTIFAVSWHRFVLLGPRRAPPQVLPTWSVSHWRFLGYTFVVGYLVLGVSLFAVFGLVAILEASGFPTLLVLLVLLLGLPASLYPSLRLSLLFPAIAVGMRLDLGQSWRFTGGEGWRLVLAMVFAWLPFAAFLWIRQLAASARGSDLSEAQNVVVITDIWLLDQVIWALPTYITLALTVTVLSLAFRHRTAWEAPNESMRPSTGDP